MNRALRPDLRYDTDGMKTNLTNDGTRQFATGSLPQTELTSTLAGQRTGWEEALWGTVVTGGS